MDLEEVWRIREEDVFPRLFGSVSRGVFPLTGSLFTERFGQADHDPRWLSHGIFEFAPTPTRSSWVYVTSGYSNPWEEAPEAYDPSSSSGSGVEFLFAAHEQGDWAIRFLQNMLAFDLLLGAGRFGDKLPLASGDRIPLRGPINGAADCLLQNAIVSEPEDLPAGFSLPSGRVTFLAFTGATDDEIAFAKENGTGELIRRLQAAGRYPVTDPRRASVV